MLVPETNNIIIIIYVSSRNNMRGELQRVGSVAGKQLKPFR